MADDFHDFLISERDDIMQQQETIERRLEDLDREKRELERRNFELTLQLDEVDENLSALRETERRKERARLEAIDDDEDLATFMASLRPNDNNNNNNNNNVDDDDDDDDDHETAGHSSRTGPRKLPANYQASDHRVDNLPLVLYKHSADGEKFCAICHDDFVEGDSVRLLPCCHKFHPDTCIDNYLAGKFECPVCRTSCNS